MKVKVVIFTDEKDLSRQEWEFRYADFAGGIILDVWRLSWRQTKRHGWKSNQLAGEVWTRLNQRDNKIERPIPPQHVIDAAIAEFAKSIVFKDEWK